MEPPQVFCEDSLDARAADIWRAVARLGEKVRLEECGRGDGFTVGRSPIGPHDVLAVFCIVTLPGDRLEDHLFHLFIESRETISHDQNHNGPADEVVDLAHGLNLRLGHFVVIILILRGLNGNHIYRPNGTIVGPSLSRHWYI